VKSFSVDPATGRTEDKDSKEQTAMRRMPLIVFLVLCALCVAQALYYYPQLPDKVASHFGASGQPDSWSTRNFFVAFYLMAVGFTASMFLAIHFGMSKMPASLINLPNKDYWLSPERRQQTSGFMSRQLLWFGCATLLLLLDIFYQSFQVHLGRAEGLSHPMLSLGLYIGFSVVWSIGLMIKFSRKGA
jgi:uncharacterized membrane protein